MEERSFAAVCCLSCGRMKSQKHVSFFSLLSASNKNPLDQVGPHLPSRGLFSYFQTRQRRASLLDATETSFPLSIDFVASHSHGPVRLSFIERPEEKRIVRPGSFFCSDYAMVQSNVKNVRSEKKKMERRLVESSVVTVWTD